MTGNSKQWSEEQVDRALRELPVPECRFPAGSELAARLVVRDRLRRSRTALALALAPVCALTLYLAENRWGIRPPDGGGIPVGGIARLEPVPAAAPRLLWIVDDDDGRRVLVGVAAIGKDGTGDR